MRLLVLFAGLCLLSLQGMAHEVVEKAEIKNLADKYEFVVRECLRLSKSLDRVQSGCIKTMKNLIGDTMYDRLHDDNNVDVRYRADRMLSKQIRDSRDVWKAACKNSRHTSIKSARRSLENMSSKVSKNYKLLNEGPSAVRFDKAMERAKEIDSRNGVYYPLATMLLPVQRYTKDAPWYSVGKPFGGASGGWGSLRVEEDILRARWGSAPSVKAVDECNLVI